MHTLAGRLRARRGVRPRAGGVQPPPRAVRVVRAGGRRAARDRGAAGRGDGRGAAAGVQGPRPGRHARHPPAAAADPARAPNGTAARRRAPRWAVVVAAAAAVVGLAAGGVFGGIALTQQERARHRAEPAGPGEAAVRAGGGAARGAGREDRPRRGARGGGVTVIVSKSLNRVMVMDAGLPAAAGREGVRSLADHRRDAPRSAGLIASPTPVAWSWPTASGSVDQLAVSVGTGRWIAVSGAPTEVLMSMPAPA